MMHNVISYNVYGDMSERIVSRHRTEAAAREAAMKLERSRERKIKGGDIASKGERYEVKEGGACDRRRG